MHDFNKDKNSGDEDKDLNRDSSSSNKKYGYYIVVLIFWFYSAAFVWQVLDKGFSKMEPFLIAVPMLWAGLAILFVLANEQSFIDKGFGWIPKFVKIGFLVLIGLIVIGIMPDCSGGSGVADNVRF